MYRGMALSLGHIRANTAQLLATTNKSGLQTTMILELLSLQVVTRHVLHGHSLDLKTDVPHVQHLTSTLHLSVICHRQKMLCMRWGHLSTSFWSTQGLCGDAV